MMAKFLTILNAICEAEFEHCSSRGDEAVIAKLQLNLANEDIPTIAPALQILQPRHLGCYNGLVGSGLDIAVGPFEKGWPVWACGVAAAVLTPGEFAIHQSSFDGRKFRCA